MLPVSKKAANLIGSEIIRLSAEIQEKIRQGKRIYNFTVGDFDPALFPIPDGLLNRIIEAYQEGHSNYPPADGTATLKTAVLSLLKDELSMPHALNEIMIASGGRPLIYAAYQSIIDPGDKVVFPTPSWNNNHYAYLTEAQKIEVPTLPENKFMPSAAELKPHLKDATLLALCSPLNPTGTVFGQGQLRQICQLVWEENQRRTGKPLYILYDQIYWMLMQPGNTHVHPLELMPELKPYVIYIDGISKGFAATGVRVGWATGPAEIISKMKSFLGHIGAWAPKAEQMATARFIESREEVKTYLTWLNQALGNRLQALHQGFTELQRKGFPVSSIEPEGAIYLTVQLNIAGKIKPDGTRIENIDQATQYMLDEAGLAFVPFYAFGCERETFWYRISVGTAKMEEIPEMFTQVENALKKLTS